MLDVTLVTWYAWERQGRLPVKGYECERDGGGRWALYHIEELNRRRDDIKRLRKPYQDAGRPGCYRVPLKSFVCYREAIIDEHSLALVEPYDWYWSPRQHGTGHGHVVLSTENASYPPRTPLARVLTETVSAGMMTRVSHLNDDPFDCRRANLVVRTMQEQLFNCRKMRWRDGRKPSSKYKGVTWNEKLGKWAVYITKDRHQRYLGLFHDEIAAAEKYDEAARELFGEHARLNFPDGIDEALEREAAEAA
jgi:hypothetical protein